MFVISRSYSLVFAVSRPHCVLFAHFVETRERNADLSPHIPPSTLRPLFFSLCLPFYLGHVHDAKNRTRLCLCLPFYLGYVHDAKNRTRFWLCVERLTQWSPLSTSTRRFPGRPRTTLCLCSTLLLGRYVVHIMPPSCRHLPLQLNLNCRSNIKLNVDLSMCKI